MALLLRLLPLGLAVTLCGCGSDLPQTPYSASTGCIELRFGGARRSGDEIVLGQLVARSDDSEKCGSLSSVRTTLFVDANGNGEIDEGEAQTRHEDPPKEFMRSINISQRRVPGFEESGSLAFIVEIETSTGESARVVGPVEP